MGPTPRSVAFTCALALAALPPSLNGQTIVDIPDRPTCGTCTLDLTRRVRPTPPPEGFPGFPQAFAVSEKGRIYFAFDQAVELMHFDAQGRFLGKAARKGEGPGEFRSLFALLPMPGESLLVFDAQLQRASLLSPSLAFQQSFRSPAPSAPPALLANGGVLLAVAPDYRSRSGHSLRIIHPQGRAEGSFGPGSQESRPEHPEDHERVFGKSNRGGEAVWVARPAVAYELHLWTVVSANPTRIIRRNAAWFPARQFPAVDPFDGKSPPPPLIRAVWEMDGLLWVALRVADPQWKKGIRAVGSEGVNHAGSPILDSSKYWDMLVEVIDPEKGQLVASFRLDRLFGTSTTPGVWITRVSAADDEPLYELTWPRLRGR